MSDIEYDPTGNSNFPLHVGADILKLLFLVRAFYVFPCIIHTKI